MNVQKFLREYPVFTYETFISKLNPNGIKSPHTLTNILSQHIKNEHIVRIKRKLFAAIPYGADLEKYVINPYLIAGFLADDAVIAYHSALAFYGFSYSVSYRIIYFTSCRAQSLSFRNETYVPTLFPKALSKNNQNNLYVNIEDVQGLDIRVTSAERTLVDVMDRPLLGGGWEEIWRSLDMINRLKIDNVIHYALLLDNATTIAKVGYYLETRKEELNVSNEQLKQLQNHRPQSAHYLDKSQKSKSRYNSVWNLMIPERIIMKTWEEQLDEGYKS